MKSFAFLHNDVEKYKKNKNVWLESHLLRIKGSIGNSENKYFRLQ